MLTLTLWMRKEETMEGKCLAKITEWWKQASHHFALKFPHTFHWQHRCSGSPSARGQAAVLPTHVPHRPWGVWTPALVQLLGPLSRGRMSGSWHCHPMSLWVGPPFVTLLGLYLLKQGDHLRHHWFFTLPVLWHHLTSFWKKYSYLDSHSQRFRCN